MKKQKKSLLKGWSRRRKVIVLVVSVIIAAALASFVTWGIIKGRETDINPDGYQAVFLTNGQVYFGKLSMFNGGTLKLTRVFYLQKSNGNESANPQNAGDTGDVQLIKLGSEIHGPQDEMVIEKSQVLFYENLKSDGNVAQTIAKYGTGK